ncbi:hypothetical protein WUBG_03177 [Wuchereria bancrofti]|uniref:Uncharacterized protein n=1 Tax=Wuchereria bancrofti TaxID=6293 RepID=J9FEY1_WUCBA|nr:hypothetical protein WUBG_03177 [Wuchereria bancrofti]
MTQHIAAPTYMQARRHRTQTTQCISAKWKERARRQVKTTSRRSSRLFLQQFTEQCVGKYEHIHTANNIIIMIAAVEVVHALWDIPKLRPPADATQSSASSNNGKL